MTVEMSDAANPAHPSQKAEEEIRIIGLIKKEFFRAPDVEDKFRKAKDIVVKYYKTAISSLDNPDKIHEDTQRILQELAQLLNSNIVDGAQHLNLVKKGSPVFLVTNHLGTYKLTSMTPSDLGLSLPIEVIHPPVMFYDALFPVASALGDKLYQAAYRLSDPIGQIQELAGTILIPTGNKVYEKVLQASAEAIRNHPAGAYATYPEAGTSGKRNNGGPYDQGKFHSGTFSIASNLDIPIIPVAQYFDSQKGFELGVLKPIKPTRNGSREFFDEVASNTQKEMQAWLDTKKSS